jgi:hypothetical protein
MDVYKRETEELMRRFLDGRMTHSECIAAMDAALAAVIPGMKEADLEKVQNIVSESQRAIAEEIGRRKDSATGQLSQPVN